MSIITVSRQCSIDEITAEMDRRGRVIELLEADNQRFRDALTAALNFIENTESELGITLGSGDKIRAALNNAEKV